MKNACSMNSAITKVSMNMISIRVSKKFSWQHKMSCTITRRPCASFHLRTGRKTSQSKNRGHVDHITRPTTSSPGTSIRLRSGFLIERIKRYHRRVSYLSSLRRHHSKFIGNGYYSSSDIAGNIIEQCNQASENYKECFKERSIECSTKNLTCLWFCSKFLTLNELRLSTFRCLTLLRTGTSLCRQHTHLHSYSTGSAARAGRSPTNPAFAPNNSYSYRLSLNSLFELYEVQIGYQLRFLSLNYYSSLLSFTPTVGFNEDIRAGDTNVVTSVTKIKDCYIWSLLWIDSFKKQFFLNWDELLVAKAKAISPFKPSSDTRSIFACELLNHKAQEILSQQKCQTISGENCNSEYYLQISALVKNAAGGLKQQETTSRIKTNTHSKHQQTRSCSKPVRPFGIARALLWLTSIACYLGPQHATIPHAFASYPQSLGKPLNTVNSTSYIPSEPSSDNRIYTYPEAPPYTWNEGENRTNTTDQFDSYETNDSYLHKTNSSQHSSDKNLGKLKTSPSKTESRLFDGKKVLGTLVRTVNSALGKLDIVHKERDLDSDESFGLKNLVLDPIEIGDLKLKSINFKSIENLFSRKDKAESSKSENEDLKNKVNNQEKQPEKPKLPVETEHLKPWGSQPLPVVNETGWTIYREVKPDVNKNRMIRTGPGRRLVETRVGNRIYTKNLENSLLKFKEEEANRSLRERSLLGIFPSSKKRVTRSANAYLFAPKTSTPAQNKIFLGGINTAFQPTVRSNQNSGYGFNPSYVTNTYRNSIHQASSILPYFNPNRASSYQSNSRNSHKASNQMDPGRERVSSWINETSNPVAAVSASMFDQLSEHEYALFKAGDVKPEYWDNAVNDPQIFHGKWQIIPGRSESVDEILKALGFGSLKRRVMATYASEIDYDVIEVGKEPRIEITTHLPLGVVKKASVKCDGTFQDQFDDHTGIWKTQSVWINGRVIQRREGKKGLMFDTRIVLRSDPLGKQAGNIQLFKWTYIPEGGQILTAHRWLKRL